MSGLEALSLACNILQIIESTKETITFCKSVYDGASPDAHLKASAVALDALSGHIYNASKAIQSPAPSQKRLCEVAERCNEAARALAEESNFLVGHHAKGSLRATLALAAKSKWRRKRLERLETEMQSHQRLLSSHLLARVCTQGDAIKAQQQEDFASLDASLQRLIACLATGQTAQANLIQATSAQVGSHVTKEAERTNRVISSELRRTKATLEDHITKEIKTLEVSNIEIRRQAVSEEQRERLLRSLKFSGMYARVNMLKDPAGKTYRWIFDEAVEDSDSGSEEASASASAGDAASEIDSVASDSASDPDSSVTGRAVLWDNFVDWLKSESQFYWISGKPGSGKSTLTKFLAKHPSTKESLSVWKPDCFVVAFYFWKPGSLLQQSIRGLCLTLLHQLLRQDIALLDHFASQHHLRDEPEDWSASDLEAIVQTALRLLHGAVCILLDGLDEICPEDGPSEIIRFIKRLQLNPSVKVCASSRPDRAFEASFGREHHLKLQDLTHRDMRLAATQALKPHRDSRGGHLRLQELIQAVCDRAEGVFLWLSLALKDLIIGITNGDSDDELKQRLKSLPSEFSDLYWDMWTRLNRSSSAQLYRKSAATYLKSILAFKVLRTLKDGSVNLPITLFELSLVTHPGNFSHDGLTTNFTLEELQEQHWSKFAHDIQVRCAGLVEVRQSPKKEAEESGRRDMSFYRPGELIFHRVDFIHRSAYDFLTETDHGQMIVAYDDTPLETRLQQLTDARLALLHFDFGRLAELWPDVSGREQRQFNAYTVPEDSRTLFHFLIERAELSSSHEARALNVLQTHFEFVEGHKHLGLAANVFLAFCCSIHPGDFKAFVWSSLQALPESERQKTAASVLRFLCFSDQPVRSFGSPFARLSRSDIAITVQRLCHFGADLDSVHQVPRHTERDREDHWESLMSTRSMIVRLLWRQHQWRANTLYLEEVLDVLCHGTVSSNLGERTCFAFQLSSSPGVSGLITLPQDPTRRIEDCKTDDIAVVEINIALVFLILVSWTSAPIKPSWQAVLHNCPPVANVRFFGTNAQSQQTDAGKSDYRIYGPFDDGHARKLLPAFVHTLTGASMNARRELIRDALGLPQDWPESGEHDRGECRGGQYQDFPDTEKGHMESYKWMVDALGLDLSY